ncbi:MAG: acyl-homoserine-lactone acylase [Marinoscillum sp.]|jgi:acyl-homoserine-lactone acylase
MMIRKLLFAVAVVAQFTVAGQEIAVSQIEIMRDTYGVPHIYAPTDPEVAYGLAWAHAEDDFETIQLTMLAGKRMLGAHLGKDGAAVDYVVSLMRCEALAKEGWSSLSPAYQKLITAYTQGLNDFAKKYPKRILLKGSFPVIVEEVLTAYVLSLAVISGADQTIQNLVSGKVEAAIDLSGRGSNAFAFNRSKTKDDRVYLNINSHQPLEGPTSWYEAHLVSEEGWNALGGLFPGGATIFHGTNENLGWAHTVNYPDKIDIFQLEMDSNNNLKYKIDEEYKTLESEEVKIQVRILFGAKISVKKTIFWSVYGPVVKNNKGYFAFDLGALHDLRAPDQWYQMNKATNWNEFKTALDMMAIPGFNIVYADKDDNIFYAGNAKIPVRNSDYNWSGTLPGNTSKTLIDKYHLFDDLPQVLNPKSGYVFNTNNSAFNCTFDADNPLPENYDLTMGYREFENNRSERFMELVEGYDRLSWEDFLEIKYDDTLPEVLAYPVVLDPIFEIDTIAYPKYAALMKVILNWDRSSSYKNIGAAQFMILYRHIVELHRDKYTGVPYPLTADEALEAVDFTNAYLKKHFKKVNISLGEYQLLVRGDKEVPVNGILDVITAMDTRPYKYGRVKAYQGESLIMLVRYPKVGLPIIETVNVYGASNQKDSPHYADQMFMFSKKQRKSMTLDIDEVRKNAKSIYHPE